MNEGNGISESTRIWYQVLNKRKARKKEKESEKIEKRKSKKYIIIFKWLFIYERNGDLD